MITLEDSFLCVCVVRYIDLPFTHQNHQNAGTCKSFIPMVPTVDASEILKTTMS